MKEQKTILAALVLSSIFSMNAWAEGEILSEDKQVKYKESTDDNQNEIIMPIIYRSKNEDKYSTYGNEKTNILFESGFYSTADNYTPNVAASNFAVYLYSGSTSTADTTLTLKAHGIKIGNYKEKTDDGYTIYNNGAFNVHNSDLSVTADSLELYNVYSGISAKRTREGETEVNFEVQNDIKINSKRHRNSVSSDYRVSGVYASASGKGDSVKVNLTSKAGTISITSQRDGLYASGNVKTTLQAPGKISITAETSEYHDNSDDKDKLEGIGIYTVHDESKGDNPETILTAGGEVSVIGGTNAVRSSGSSNIKITGTNGVSLYADNELNDKQDDIGIAVYITNNNDKKEANLSLESDNNISIKGERSAIKSSGNYMQNIVSKYGSVNIIGNAKNGIYSSGTQYENDVINIKAGKNINIQGVEYGIENIQNSTVNVSAQNGNIEVKSNNTENKHQTAIAASNSGIVNLIAENGTNTVSSNDTAIVAYKNSTVTIKSRENKISGLVTSGYKHSNDYINENDNDNSSIEITGIKNEIVSKTAIQEFVGNYNDKGEDVIVAVFSGSDGNNNSIKITADNGGENIIRVVKHDGDMQRAVWAYNGGNVEINGRSIIYAENSDGYSGNNYNLVGVALAAGSGDKGLDNTSKVIANLGSNSKIYGAALAGYYGEVCINGSEKDNIMMIGDVLAGNGGSVNVNIGNQGTLVGHADTYMDAGADKVFENSYFSQSVESAGYGKIVLGTGSTWNVTAQSWIDKVSLQDKNAVIDMVNADIGSVGSTHAMTIGSLEGSGTLKMHLQRDRKASDMLYIGNTSGNTYNIELNEVVTTDDMYADGHTGLRFATLGKGSDAKFEVTAKDQGMYNVRYLVGTDDFDTSAENKDYNLEQQDIAYKPGNDTVTTFLSRYNKDEQPESEKTRMLLAAAEETKKTGATNYKLIAMNTDPDIKPPDNNVTDPDIKPPDNNVTDPGIKPPSINLPKPELSTGGKTVLMQGQANYKNAVYLDRLNKRMGEVRYINEREDAEKDEGAWVRVRHDRIGMENSFRSRNTMYEIGYDKQQECDSGERRFGAAFDYMRGSTSYHNIYGKGEIKRVGLWLYDTWMGTKGHYVDYVAKWGHLENEFDILAGGNKVTGDYCNNVFSFSTEYGRKKDMGKDWYIEPQAQLQFAYVTDADYMTSQGTRLETDSIKSLIGRLGFRLGKDYGKDEEKKSTFYLKADVLHEFLGDSEIRAIDKTTDNKWSGISFDNKGTWYDVGLGYSAMTGKNSYMYVDVEKSFGGGNDDTYQINAGMQWSF